jgi:hypothetical protein
VRVALLIAGLLMLASAPARAAPYYAISPGATVKINEHGYCYNVTNNLGSTTLVPTNTAAEWLSFLNNAAGHTKTVCPWVCTPFNYYYQCTGGNVYAADTSAAACIAACQSTSSITCCTYVDFGAYVTCRGTNGAAYYSGAGWSAANCHY